MSNEQFASKIEAIALERCASLLETPTAKIVPRPQIEAIVILAFAQGAAWALDDEKINQKILIANAQMEAMRSPQQ